MDVESIDKTVAVIDSFECTEQRLPVSHIVSVKKSGQLEIIAIENIIGVSLVVDVQGKGVYLCGCLLMHISKQSCHYLKF